MNNKIIIKKCNQENAQPYNQTTIIQPASCGHKELAMPRCSKCHGSILFSEFTRVDTTTIQYECICGHVDKIIE